MNRSAVFVMAEGYGRAFTRALEQFRWLRGGQRRIYEAVSWAAYLSLAWLIIYLVPWRRWRYAALSLLVLFLFLGLGRGR